MLQHSTHTCTHICIHSSTHAHTRTCACAHTKPPPPHPQTHTRTHPCARTCTHTHTHSHTQTHSSLLHLRPLIFSQTHKTLPCLHNQQGYPPKLGWASGRIWPAFCSLFLCLGMPAFMSRWKKERLRHSFLTNVKQYLFLGLARTVYIHRLWPYIWWCTCQKYRIYTVYIWLWPTLRILHVTNTTARQIAERKNVKQILGVMLASPSVFLRQALRTG